MKVFLGISLLIGGFLLVLVLRERSIDAAVAEDAAEVRPGWASVRVGRPSGAQPVETPAPARRAPATAPTAPSATTPNSPSQPPAPATTPAASEEREFELTVQRGQTLSEICRAHYKTARPSLVEAVAKHNGLKDAGALREGAKLRLPPIETLEKR